MRGTIFDVPSKGVNVKQGWAHHYGGRTEVQYNIGFEQETARFRFGLAFSLEPSQFVKDVVAHLAPKCERFNELVLAEPELFSKWQKWVWDNGKISVPDTVVRAITADEVWPGRFIFFGSSLPTDRIDEETILKTFDELLPVYRFIEGHPDTLARLFGGTSKLAFQERFDLPENDSHDRSAQKEGRVDLKSRRLTRLLKEMIEGEDPGARFGTEISSGSGGLIDLVVKTSDGIFDL